MQIEITRDGSSTIFLPEWNERYHSKNGALQESLYVYIQQGLSQILKNKIHILEIGFGTGLNALLTYIHQKANSFIDYTTIEPYPLPKEIILQLNYFQLEPLKNYANILTLLHQCSFNQVVSLNSNFLFIKHPIKIQDFSTIKRFDLVYWDAFGPRVQPEMWSLDLCQKIYNLLNPKGIIVTYCSQGQFKRNLKQTGFQVEVLPGPPFKREMTRATKVN